MTKTRRDILLLVFVTLASTLAVWFAVGMKTIYENFDGPYYAVVAKSWYNTDIIRTQFAFPLPVEYYAAHLPLYPALMAVGGLVGMSLLSSGVIVTLISSVVGSLVIYTIWKRMGWEQPFIAASAWLFLWPRMWAVRSIASPEPLFVLLIMLSLFAFTKKQYLWAGIAGALAVLTKSPGMLLLPVYGLWAIREWQRTKRIPWSIWPVALPLLAFGWLCAFYGLRMGDFLAYFNSGDNIHLQLMPFKVFDSGQSWVGTFWLEDVLWIYLIAGFGVMRAIKKNFVWGLFGLVFLLILLFVSHRDISRYSLPLVPVVLLGYSELLAKKEFRVLFGLWLIPAFFFTINFLTYNSVTIADWSPFFLFSK